MNRKVIKYCLQSDWLISQTVDLDSATLKTSQAWCRGAPLLVDGASRAMKHIKRNHLSVHDFCFETLIDLYCGNKRTKERCRILRCLLYYHCLRYWYLLKAISIYAKKRHRFLLTSYQPHGNLIFLIKQIGNSSKLLPCQYCCIAAPCGL